MCRQLLPLFYHSRLYVPESFKDVAEKAGMLRTCVQASEMVKRAIQKKQERCSY